MFLGSTTGLPVFADDGCLMVPEALSLVPPGPQPKLVSEGQRIKLLQSGPAII